MAPVVVGVSLKMYFGYARAREWFSSIADLARDSEALKSGDVELFVIPSFVAIPAAIDTLDGTDVVVGAQDLFWDDNGAYTGEVSGVELAELGVGVVEVGHAERRRIFAETEEIVAAKTTAALRNGIAPVLCIGEIHQGEADAAARDVIRQLRSALHGAPAGRVIVAYEPVWAIGAAEPASADHIRAVCAELRTVLDSMDGRDGSSVIYGGSAGPGLLTTLGSDVDGLFLGRFAHDPTALGSVLDEAATLAESAVRS
ncbi:triosephosphate isomerase [Okibacterium sp. HSC-33S16]|uniref:triose-phosphate isomerase family protein n=1 Tax=Okibacterium sp. HSC-33S16 TaxID=2910965 RepID=UPI00209EE6B2|nr:triose-phosphate isomerase family protein [Okibacterium sp. HSC-33S16]MCP2031174.1 triosephosphate isomerase [Okibacterium sp. HSC-33S16]